MEGFSWEVLCDATDRPSGELVLEKQGLVIQDPEPSQSETERVFLGQATLGSIHPSLQSSGVLTLISDTHSGSTVDKTSSPSNLTTSPLSQKPTQAAPSQHGPWAVSTVNQVQHGRFTHPSSTICSGPVLSRHPSRRTHAHLAFTQWRDLIQPRNQSSWSIRGDLWASCTGQFPEQTHFCLMTQDDGSPCGDFPRHEVRDL